MSILPLVQLDQTRFFEKHPILREPSHPVTDFGPSLQTVIDDLLDTFLSHRIAVGLAAPQIGVQLRAAVINTDKDRTASTSLILINPNVIAISGKKDTKKEACMSLPGFQGSVERRHKIEIAYQNKTGGPEHLKAEGFLSRVIFHEMDHLDGILYIDRMTPPAKMEQADFFKDD